MRKLLTLTKGSHFSKTLLRIIAITIIAAIAALSPINVLASFNDGYHEENYYFCWTNDKGTVNYQNTESDSYSVQGYVHRWCQ